VGKTLRQNILAERFSAFDGIRAFAALMVVFFHAFTPDFRGGFIGVDVFFVLSGFLITTLLRQEIENYGHIDYWAFIKRRAIRLYPSMLLVLVALAIAAPLLWPETQLWKELVYSGLYISNYTRALYSEPDLTNHTWSLATEAQFYLIWPFVVILLCRFKVWQAVAMLAAAYIVLTLWRMSMFQAYGMFRTYYALDTRMSGLVLGAVIAFVAWRPSLRGAFMLGLVSVFVLLTASRTFSFYDAHAAMFGGLMTELAAGALLLAAAKEGSIPNRILAWAPCARLGLWSYAIYLWHYPVSRYFRVEDDGYMPTLTILAVTVTLAGVTYEIYERHVVKALRNLGMAEPRKTTG
jgi:peptidoglycan/LPS O-acetylase OafA/YrhL